MEWLTQNWIWVLVGAAFIALHMFGHGGHGGHGNGDDGTLRPRIGTETRVHACIET